MSIKVNSVEEEYEYIRQHPHQCAGNKTGEWVKLGKKPMTIGLDVLLMKCKECGHEEAFEFDAMGCFPKEMQEIFKSMRKE